MLLFCHEMVGYRTPTTPFVDLRLPGATTLIHFALVDGFLHFPDWPNCSLYREIRFVAQNKRTEGALNSE
jgi:hypothetical protein